MITALLSYLVVLPERFFFCSKSHSMAGGHRVARSKKCTIFLTFKKMANRPNHFISGKQFQRGQIWLIGLFKGQMATLRWQAVVLYLQFQNKNFSQTFFLTFLKNKADVICRFLCRVMSKYSFEWISSFHIQRCNFNSDHPQYLLQRQFAVFSKKWMKIVWLWILFDAGMMWTERSRNYGQQMRAC